MNKNKIEAARRCEDPIVPKDLSKRVPPSVSNNFHRKSVIRTKNEKSLNLHSQSQQKFNQAMEEKCNSQRNTTIPVPDFLRSFRENGAHFVSSAYL